MTESVSYTHLDVYKRQGLGLAIVKEIIEAHGERVAVHSVPGEGSTFSFTLPLARADLI